MSSAALAKSRLKNILRLERSHCFQLNWTEEEKDRMTAEEYEKYLRRLRAYMDKQFLEQSQ